VGLPETQDDRQFASFMFGRIGVQLCELNAFSVAARFIDAAEGLNPSNADLAVFAEEVRMLRGVEDDVDAVLEDDRVHDFVKHTIALLYQNAIGALPEAEARLQEVLQAFDNVMQADPDHSQIKKSVRRVRRKYGGAYKLNEELFDVVLDLPATDMFAAPCPHCDETIVAHKRRHLGDGECPHCGRATRFTGSAYERRSSSRRASRGSGSASGQTASSGGDGEGCFIATAVYGDYDHPDVVQLRAFRDSHLAPHALGRAFIRMYYQHGPGWAKRLKRYPRVSGWVRRVLASFVHLLR
jgi:ribosomal protein L37AE/L43A